MMINPELTPLISSACFFLYNQPSQNPPWTSKIVIFNSNLTGSENEAYIPIKVTIY